MVRAAANGELWPGVEPPAALAVLYGPLYTPLFGGEVPQAKRSRRINGSVPVLQDGGVLSGGARGRPVSDAQQDFHRRGDGRTQEGSKALRSTKLKTLVWRSNAGTSPQLRMLRWRSTAGRKNARICTFCASCAADRFANVCPNCGGELVRRPIRPADRLVKYPGSTSRVRKSHAECVEVFSKSSAAKISART